MREQTYRNISQAVNSMPLMKAYIVWFNRIITLCIYLLYPALLVLLYLRHDPRLLPVIVIPGVSFILLSLVRHWINFPRPYEVYDIPPVIDKKTTGHSLPSRHIFCMFLIATTVFYIQPVAGILIGLAGCSLAFGRVIGGVHFVRDVVTGALAGVLCGVIGFYVILPLIS